MKLISKSLLALTILTVGTALIHHGQASTILNSSELSKESKASLIESEATEILMHLVESEIIMSIPTPLAHQSIEELATQIFDSNATTKFELPVHNSMGYSLVETNVRTEPNNNSTILWTTSIGTTFLIKEEVDEWLLVEFENGSTGYVYKLYVLVNLPDIVPSIIYNAVNGESSIFLGAGKEIPNVTGLAFYEGLHYNARLEKDEYVLPVLYPMAEKIYAAQQLALEQGDTLVIYEGYRPYDLQNLVYQELTNLAHNDSEVSAALSVSPWHLGWFIASGVSTHQTGLAIDVSLAQINDYQVGQVGEYLYFDITDYTEYEMPTALHDLSAQAVSLAWPVSWKTSMSWADVTIANSMTEGAVKLRDYCTSGGLEPLASEWWHFNDVENYFNLGTVYATGSIKPTSCISLAP